MAVKKAIYQVDNGASFDEIHFRTSEEQIVGARQSLGKTGWRKLPGGLILQWGESSANTAWTNVVFPVAFNTLSFATVIPRHETQGLVPLLRDMYYTNKFMWKTSSSSQVKAYWFAIGY